MNTYENIVSQFELKQGDSIWLSTELIKLVLSLKKKQIKFDGNELIDAFQKAVGEEGTILIPTFSFDFSNKHHYDFLNTKGFPPPRWNRCR